MTKGVRHLSVNQPHGSYLAKVYKLIIAVSTAAQHKPERCSKTKPQKELSPDVNSNFAFLVSDNEVSKEVK